MINATVAGNIGKDAETREAGGNTVTSFSVASSTKKGREETTTWVNCSIWGNRGPALAQYLTKGKQVCVSGSLTTRVYNDKTYVELNVNDVKLMGGKSDGNQGAKAGRDPDPQGHEGDADDIPFITNVTSEPEERWLRKNWG